MKTKNNNRHIIFLVNCISDFFPQNDIYTQIAIIKYDSRRILVSVTYLILFKAIVQLFEIMFYIRYIPIPKTDLCNNIKVLESWIWFVIIKGRDPPLVLIGMPIGYWSEFSSILTVRV